MHLATFEKPFLGICRFFDSVSMKLLQMLSLYFQSREARNSLCKHYEHLRAPTSLAVVCFKFGDEVFGKSQLA